MAHTITASTKQESPSTCTTEQSTSQDDDMDTLCEKLSKLSVPVQHIKIIRMDANTLAADFVSYLSTSQPSSVLRFRNPHPTLKLVPGSNTVDLLVRIVLPDDFEGTFREIGSLTTRGIYSDGKVIKDFSDLPPYLSQTVHVWNSSPKSTELCMGQELVDLVVAPETYFTTYIEGPYNELRTRPKLIIETSEYAKNRPPPSDLWTSESVLCASCRNSAVDNTISRDVGPRNNVVSRDASSRESAKDRLGPQVNPYHFGTLASGDQENPVLLNQYPTPYHATQSANDNQKSEDQSKEFTTTLDPPSACIPTPQDSYQPQRGDNDSARYTDTKPYFQDHTSAKRFGDRGERRSYSHQYNVRSYRGKNDSYSRKYYNSRPPIKHSYSKFRSSSSARSSRSQSPPVTNKRDSRTDLRDILSSHHPNTELEAVREDDVRSIASNNTEEILNNDMDTSIVYGDDLKSD